MSAPRWNGVLHKPVKFGDRPSGKTVEGRKVAARKAVETRRLNRLMKDRQEEERLDRHWGTRLLNALGWLLGDRGGGTAESSSASCRFLRHKPVVDSVGQQTALDDELAKGDASIAWNAERFATVL